jgi:gluconate 2-dehydrogenase alpha chain
MRRTNFEARTLCEVTRINLDNTGKRATGVTYVDARGREWEQPAEMVFLCAFQMFNVQLLLLSGIGQPYDVTTGQGVIGRNYSYQVTSSVEAFFDNKIFNPFIASGAIGMCIDDYNGDNFDHGPYGFVGGGYMGMVQPNARPIEVTPTPPGTPQWGAAWKKAVKDNYLSTILPAAHGSCYSYRDCYLDLDPTYKDRFGRPLMRLTFDFHENELKMSQFLTDRLAEIVQKMGPRQIVKLPRTRRSDGDRRLDRRRICQCSARPGQPLRHRLRTDGGRGHPLHLASDRCRSARNRRLSEGPGWRRTNAASFHAGSCDAGGAGDLR